MIRTYHLVLLALICPTALRGQDSVAVACDSATTTYDMRRCASRGLDSARKTLQRYLAEARRVAANRKLVDSAQTRWERYKDFECRAAAAEYEGGTMQPLVEVTCLQDLIRDRIRQLYNHYLRTSDSALPEPKP